MNSKRRLMLLQTTATQENAIALIQIVLESKLSVCIQQTDIQSHYFWSNSQNPNLLDICEEKEILLTFKVFKKDFKALRKLIVKNHNYEIPEIVGIKLHKVSKKYKKWCKEMKAR